jgi:hypothetical protein
MSKETKNSIISELPCYEINGDSGVISVARDNNRGVVYVKSVRETSRGVSVRQLTLSVDDAKALLDVLSLVVNPVAKAEVLPFKPVDN